MLVDPNNIYSRPGYIYKAVEQKKERYLSASQRVIDAINYFANINSDYIKYIDYLDKYHLADSDTRKMYFSEFYYWE